MTARVAQRHVASPKSNHGAVPSMILLSAGFDPLYLRIFPHSPPPSAQQLLVGHAKTEGEGESE